MESAYNNIYKLKPIDILMGNEESERNSGITGAELKGLALELGVSKISGRIVDSKVYHPKNYAAIPQNKRRFLYQDLMRNRVYFPTV